MADGITCTGEPIAFDRGYREAQPRNELERTPWHLRHLMEQMPEWHAPREKAEH